MDLNTADAKQFAEAIRWAVLLGYMDGEDSAPAASTPSQLLERAACTGSHDHGLALQQAYQLGRKHFEWTVNRPQVERSQPSRAGMPVHQHTVSPARTRPQPHTELYPRSAATSRPAMAIPLNPAVQRPAPQHVANLRAPWKA